MKLTILTFVLFITLGSCTNDKPVDNSSDMLEMKQQIPDTVLTKNDSITNEFQFDLNDKNIDLQKTKSLQGVWIATTGQLEFLNTSIESGNRIIFSDTIFKSMTGWGTIIYNREAKFYITEAGSHIYDYFIDKKGLLNLVQYEYRNEDLSFKKQPVPIYKKFTINWTKYDQIELKIKNNKVTLIRKK